MADAILATRRVTGLAGLTVALLFSVGNALWAFDQPQAGAPSREIVAFYTDASARIIVGASLSLLAAVLFVFFASGLRAILREHEGDDQFATAAFGGALLVVAAGLGAETITMVGALRADGGQLTPELGRALFEISYVLGYNGAGLGICVLVSAAAAVALRVPAFLPAGSGSCRGAQRGLTFRARTLSRAGTAPRRQKPHVRTATADGRSWTRTRDLFLIREAL